MTQNTTNLGYGQACYRLLPISKINTAYPPVDKIRFLSIPSVPQATFERIVLTLVKNLSCGHLPRENKQCQTSTRKACGIDLSRARLIRVVSQNIWTGKKPSNEPDYVDYDTIIRLDVQKAFDSVARAQIIDIYRQKLYNLVYEDIKCGYVDEVVVKAKANKGTYVDEGNEDEIYGFESEGEVKAREITS